MFLARTSGQPSFQPILIPVSPKRQSPVGVLTQIDHSFLVADGSVKPQASQFQCWWSASGFRASQTVY